MINRSARATALALLILALLSAAAWADTETAKENYNKALTFQQAGDTASAIMTYTATLAEDPNFIDAYMNLGAIYFATADYDKALNTYQTAREKAPDNAEVLANLGRVQQKLKKYQDAEESLKAAIAISPENGALYRDLGMAYYAAKDYKTLIVTLDKAHELGAGDHLTWFMLGKANQKLGKDTGAIEAFTKSTKIKPDYYNAHNSLGQVYLALEKYSKAGAAFKAALKAAPQKYLAAYNYAIAVESADPDNFDGSIAVWNEFIKIGKKHAKAKTRVAEAEGHVKDLREAKEKASLN